jgi:hypothetical protein
VEGESAVGRWVRVERSYKLPYDLTDDGWRAVFKWLGLAWMLTVVNTVLSGANVGFLDYVTTACLIAYAIYRFRRSRAPLLSQPAQQPVMPVPGKWTFNPPPDWPPPPPGWTPPVDWQPDPSWPPAPPGWQLWVRAPRSYRRPLY